MGNDSLTGGAGADTFRFTNPDDILNNDTLTDFGDGDLIALDFQGIYYIGESAFSGVPGEYSLSRSLYGGKYDYSYVSKLVFDFDGDKVADANIAIPNYFGLTQTLEESARGSNQLTAALNVTSTGTTANDTLTGGNGYDTLSGNTGNDSLSGGSSKDVLNGEDGSDTLVGGLGSDLLTGGLGNDTFKYNSLAEISGDYITDLAVGDKINLSAITGLTFVGVGNDFSGIANQVRVSHYSLYTSKGGLYSGKGTTSYYYSLAIDTNGDKASDYSLVLPDNLILEETATGSNIFQVVENKVINGTSSNERLTGGNGNDSLTGNGGNDTLVGGFGADTLDGGLGNDTFKYNASTEMGDGHLYGSPGYKSDTITEFLAGDKIDLSTISELTFVGVGNGFSGIANQVRVATLYGSKGSPVKTTIDIDTNGDKASDYNLVLPGDLIIEETTVGSKIFRVAENKLLNGTAANNTLTGANGNDILQGWSGDDSLFGGYGADTLIGGKGSDNLTGGVGNDVFKYNSLTELGNVSPYETITDMSLQDYIDLSAIDANPKVKGDQAFSFIGSNNYTGVAGELRFSSGILFGDVNGDQVSDFTINILGSYVPTTADFIL